MRKNLVNSNIINNLLCYINPKMPISNSHYVCGTNLALFTNMAQIENCLTSITDKCKCLNQGTKSLLRNEEKK